MIDILMTTYNGESYLTNQIYSLLQQTESHWNLWVRDDGSTDKTVDIIKKFAQLDARIHFIEDELGNLGPAKGFIGLTKYSNSEYVIFCDQDDIWFEKKLELLLAAGQKKLNKDKPGLVYCDGYGYSDTEGVVTNNSISRSHAYSLNEFLFFNAGYQGCSILFNKALCQLAKDYKAEYYHMHDDIISLMAHTFGDVFFLNKALMLYRQHDKNVTGNIQLGWKGFINRVFQSGGFIISKAHYLEKKSFYIAYKKQLSKEQKQLFEAYLSFPSVSLFKRIMLLIKYNFKEGQSRAHLLVKVLLRNPLQ